MLRESQTEALLTPQAEEGRPGPGARPEHEDTHHGRQDRQQNH